METTNNRPEPADTSLDLTRQFAEDLVEDFVASTDYITKFDCSDEEFVNTIGEALHDLVVRLATHAHFNPNEFLDACKEATPG